MIGLTPGQELLTGVSSCAPIWPHNPSPIGPTLVGLSMAGELPLGFPQMVFCNLLGVEVVCNDGTF
jgi:hypothetical protein